MRRLFLCLALLFCANARAATFTVDRLDDANISTCSASSNDCTLRGALNAANTAAGDDVIAFGASVTGIIQLTGVLPGCSTNIDLQGPGANVLTVRGEGAADPYRIFSVDNNNLIVSISGLTIANGKATNVGGGAILNNHGALTLRNCVLSGNSGDDGGAIYSSASTNAGSLNVTGCTFSNNVGAFAGGGIYNDGFNGNAPLTVTNCTFSGNSTQGAGGAIYSNGEGSGAATVTVTGSTFTQNHANDNGGAIVNTGGATLIASNSTFSSNTANNGSGAGIFNAGTATFNSSTFSGNNANNRGGAIFSDANAVLNLSNSIVAGNSANTDGAEISGTLASGDYNLVQAVSGVTLTGTHNVTGQAALLGALANNGGPTQTLALLAGSPAINAGSTALTTDQRGFNRPSGSGADIGAFEAGGLPTLAVNNPRSLPEGSAGSPGSVTFDVTLSGAGTQSITVKYQTVNGLNNPATAGVDYVAKSGKLTFAPGETLKRVTIAFIGDSTPELNETFFFDLNTPTNASIADNRGVGQINNDDGPSITIEDNAINEGSSGTTAQKFIVRLSAASSNTITVAYTTANGTAFSTAESADYVATSGTLTFAPGQTSKLITVLVNGDTKAEPDETYKVNLSLPTFAVLTDAHAVGTIRNDDATPQLFDDEPSR